MPDRYKPIDRKKTSDLIVQELWSLIISGELKPGDKLPPERELVEKFNVSKVTLREALQTLEAYGHITRKRGPQGGSTILDIAPTTGVNLIVDYLKVKQYSLKHVVESRLLFEPLIAELATRRITPAERERLKMLVSEHEKDFQSRGTSRHGWEFELQLAKICKNPIIRILAELFMRLGLDIEFSLAIDDLQSTVEQLQYNEESLSSHKKILAAVADRNPEKAKQEMIQHRKNWAKLIQKLYDNHHVDRKGSYRQ